MLKKYRYWILVGLLLVWAVYHITHQQTLYREKKNVLGTVFEIAFYERSNQEGRLKAQRIFKSIFLKLSSLDSKLNPLNPISELSTINENAADNSVKVSTEIFQLLSKAKNSMQISEGAFSVFLPSRIEQEIVSSFNIPAQLAIQSPAEVEMLELDAGYQYVHFKSSGNALNVSRIQKGFAMDLIINLLVENDVRHAWIQAGSTAVALGKMKYTVKSPYDKKLFPIGKIQIRNKSVAQIRYADEYGRKLYELRDSIYPKAQGMPKALSVVVVAPNAITSEVFADTLMLKGPFLGEEWMKNFPYDYAILWQDANGKNRFTGTKYLKHRLRW